MLHFTAISHELTAESSTVVFSFSRRSRPGDTRSGEVCNHRKIWVSIKIVVIQSSASNSASTSGGSGALKSSGTSKRPRSSPNCRLPDGRIGTNRATGRPPEWISISSPLATLRRSCEKCVFASCTPTAVMNPWKPFAVDLVKDLVHWSLGDRGPHLLGNVMQVRIVVHRLVQRARPRHIDEVDPPPAAGVIGHHPHRDGRRQ